MSKQLQSALQMCYAWHKDQVDKHGQPYCLHPMAVAMECETEEQKVVALLHDILEDTDCDFARIVDNFEPKHISGSSCNLQGKIMNLILIILKRCSKNKLAKYVKTKDLQHNLSEFRGSIPSSLKKRYERALEMLAPTPTLEQVWTLFDLMKKEYLKTDITMRMCHKALKAHYLDIKEAALDLYHNKLKYA